MKIFPLCTFCATLPILVGCASDTPQSSPTPPHPQEFSLAAQKLSSSALQNPVLFSLPGMDQVTVAAVTYADDLTMDIYYPPGFDFSESRPAVVFVFGIPDGEAQLQWGTTFKDMGQYVSWSQLVAASDMIAVTYETGRSPFGATNDPIEYITRNGPYLGIDTDRLCLWSGSSHSLAALRILTDTSKTYKDSLLCGVIFYGDTLVTRPLQSQIPLLVVEAGQDTSATNLQIRAFVDQAEKAGVPVEFLTYPDGVHAFEISQDTYETHEIVMKTLEFLRVHLLDQ